MRTQREPRALFAALNPIIHFRIFDAWARRCAPLPTLRACYACSGGLKTKRLRNYLHRHWPGINPPLLQTAALPAGQLMEQGGEPCAEQKLCADALVTVSPMMKVAQRSVFMNISPFGITTAVICPLTNRGWCETSHRQRKIRTRRTARSLRPAFRIW